MLITVTKEDFDAAIPYRNNINNEIGDTKIKDRWYSMYSANCLIAQAVSKAYNRKVLIFHSIVDLQGNKIAALPNEANRLRYEFDRSDDDRVLAQLPFTFEV